jgi:hypothetical protein
LDRCLSYSDPFGLCPPEQECPFEEIVNAAKAQGRELLNTVGDAGNALKGFLTSVGKEVALQAALLPLTGGEGNAIRITEAGLEHVIERHTAEGALSAGKSIFAAGEDITALARSSEGVAAVKQGFGRNFQRVVNAGREIGIDRATGRPTSAYTVITNIKNELVTMFPGHP